MQIYRVMTDQILSSVTATIDTMFRRVVSIIVGTILILSVSSRTQPTLVHAAADYGVDCSFPIHHENHWSCGNLLGNRSQVYQKFMEGCHEYYRSKRQASRCDGTEADRLEMSVRQPQSMVNYTNTGFKKIRAPSRLYDLLLQHWNTNQDQKTQEQWFVGNTYTNHWESPTFMVSVEDSQLRGGGSSLKQQLWDAVKETIEQWTGMEQQPTSMYGIREYTRNAMLSPHVDRLPLVSSCIVNVAQDVDEPWPLEIYDRQGKAVNVTMEPGEMVLYESGSLIHGRPFPLNGRSFANIFIHFEPTGRPLNDHSNKYLETLDDFYPPYLVPQSPEFNHWAERNPNGWRSDVPSGYIQQLPSPEAHAAAATGDIYRLHKVAKQNKEALYHKDVNGWQPVHEAARAGHTEVVKLLIQHGVEKDARTGRSGNGSSVLNLAVEYLGENHDLVHYLRSIGAADYAQSEL